MEREDYIMAIELTAAEYEEKVTNSKGLIILDFYNDNCAQCESLARELAKVSEEHPEIPVYSISLIRQPELVKKHRVMAAPCMFFMKDGAQVKKTLGYKSKSSIEELIANFS